MSSKTDDRLTSGQRLTRGLKYSAVGPVDVTLGTLGLGLHGAQSSASWIGDRYRKGRLRAQLREDVAAVQESLAQELAAAQEVVANFPSALADARRSRRRRRPLIFAALGAVVVAGGAVAFSIIRRSSQPEPSAASQSRPPSVDVAPKP
ncbi:cell wall synthesis protein CwsA [Mycobacterium sp.]|uniref:cell wall synthesis protein CwsA n=1 Tax=Mycobacterium sp. TaxID=1785 RepID=UPI002B86985C|nr:cell wall synthesis protein CwsA [Mycobacterium sp.]HKP43219.1 cell wall synthesis protein CwsA [Mycobacterium sp.]